MDGLSRNRRFITQVLRSTSRWAPANLMKWGLVACCLLVVRHPALAGGTDYWYMGLLNDRLHTYEFSAEWSRYPQRATLSQDGMTLVAVQLQHGLTRDVSDPANPAPPLPPPVTGCAMVLDEEKALSLVCGSSASLPAFRGVVYVLSVEATTGKSWLTCVQKCSSQIPKRFNLVNWDSGED